MLLPQPTPAQVRRALSALANSPARTAAVLMAAQVMALSMNVKRVSQTPADRLYTEAFARHERLEAKYKGRRWTSEAIERHIIFYRGFDELRAQLRGGYHPKRREGARPKAPRFTHSQHYEHLEFIMRHEPKRFFRMSPHAKRCLSFYLELKRRAEWRPAARPQES
jgi:hypothetical protein